MNTITLTRFIHVDIGTVGRFTAPGLGQTLWSVELSWNANHAGQSCIPEGTYPLRPHDGERFKDVWAVDNVPGRTAILIHPANLPSELRGCIAPCLHYKLVPAVTKPSYYKVEGVSSRAACQHLFKLIQRMHDSGGAQLLVRTHRGTLSEKEPQA